MYKRMRLLKIFEILLDRYNVEALGKSGASASAKLAKNSNAKNVRYVCMSV